MSLQRLIRKHNLARSSHKRGDEMSDALTRLALEAPTDAAARRIFEGGERDARNDPAACPRLLEHAQSDRNRAARVSSADRSPEAEFRLALYARQRQRIAELETQLVRARFAVGLLLGVLAALAVAYLLTTGRVPMLLAQLTYRTQ